MDQTTISFDLAKPEDLPRRLMETQVLLLEAINLNIRLVALFSESVPPSVGQKARQLFDDGNTLFDQVVRLTQGKPNDD